MNYTDAIATLRQADPILAGVMDQVGDCQLGRDRPTGDLLSCLAESILYQQLSGKAAATIHRRFLQLYADRPHPTAQDILNTDDERLRSAGISRAKVVYLKDLAQKVLDGLPSLEELNEMEDEAIIQTLLPIKGVGRWTVQMLLMFRLLRPDVLPTDDLGIRNSIHRLYQLPDPPTRRRIEQIAQPWQPYRTIACWYLWRSLDL